jgi:glutamyl-tRNA synthetase
MSISVRFAPSPTGLLHVGNMRLALINYLYAKKHEGKFWLRLDDTDEERSKPEYATEIEHALGWVGLAWDRFTKQSDRMAQYAAAAEQLKASGRLYPAFETPEELSLKRKARLSQGLPPIYDRSALAIAESDRERYAAEERRAHWRFKLEPGLIEWPDLVHGHMKFDAETMSDPVVIREDGRPLFILSGAVDDAEFGITHIIRGDDHIANTAVQIQIFKALDAAIPVFAHLPLLLDAEGDKLSKRLGSLSIKQLREEEGIEPLALASLLAKLGTSDPIEPRASLDQLVREFDLSKVNHASSRFDYVELERLSAKVLHKLRYADVVPRLTARGLTDLDEHFWQAVQGNLTRFSDIDLWWQIAQGPVTPTIQDREFASIAARLLPPEPWDDKTWETWTVALKEETGRSGKALFLPLRLALTGQEHGPEMRVVLPLIGRERSLMRLAGQAA